MLPLIFLFNVIEGKLKIKNTIDTENMILDMAFDNIGRLWITNFVDSKTKNIINIISKVFINIITSIFYIKL